MVRHVQSPDARLWLSLASGLWLGLVGEGLLFAWAQGAKVEAALVSDFKVLALLADGVDEERLTVARERLMFQPDVAAVEFVSRARALESLAARDPDLARAAALLGDNPLPSAFEVRFTADGLSRLSRWLEAARQVAEVAAIDYRPAQVQAALQARAVRRFLALILSLGFWGLVLGGFYFLIPGFVDPERVLRKLWDGAPMMAWGALGAAVGAAAALALALPIRSASPFWAWPPPWALAVLAGAGGLAGWLADRLLP